MRPIPECAGAFVAVHEACRLDSYQDAAGVWTIGYGHTGPEVHAGLCWTDGQARAALDSDLSRAAARLAGLVRRPVIDGLTENQYAALLSFVFNLGANPDWTLWKLLNGGRYDQIPAQMARFVFVGGRKLNGLVARRNAEIALWSTGEPGVADERPPSSYTRAEPTPPAPALVTPVTRSGTALTGAAQLVGGLSAGALAVQQTVAPHVSEAAVLGKVVAALAVFITGCGLVLLGIKWAETQRART